MFPRILLFLFLTTAAVMQAEVKLPALFTDGMVVQQNTIITLRGSATANKKVSVTASWNKRSVVTRAADDGSWEAQLSTPKADGIAHSITISDGEKLTLSNLLLGEVWLCSGQSNMEMPMKGFKNQPVEGSNMDILKSANPNIRLFTVKRNSTIEPQTTVSGQWQEARPETVREFSATAWYFGQLLEESMQVPVGLIVSSWGGSSVEAWMSEEMLRSFPQVNIPRKESDIKEKNRTPTTLYQAMIHPLVGFPIKGIIWYQGESNYDRAHTYTSMFSTMVKGWREQWAQQDTIPFYYCQIAPYDYSIITAKGKDVINSAYLREAQLNALKQIPASGMAVLLDAGLKEGIHPPKKRIAGERLALLALGKTYGMKGFACESPEYDSMEAKNDTLILSFKKADMWLTAPAGESKLFTVAGEDRIFHPAKAWIVRSKVYVHCPSVAKPVAVRYAFDNYAEGDLTGTEGLPVSSFRTDNW